MITGKVAIVTGASSGIGGAIAIRLARSGVKVMLAARRKERLGNIKATILSQGGVSDYCLTDVVEPDAVQAMVDKTLQKWGKVDILVNNAGVMHLSMLKNGHGSDWIRMVDVNLKGVLHGVAAVLPLMRAQKSGDILVISSVAKDKVFPGSSVYSATKAAVHRFCDGLRLEMALEKMPVRVTVIAAGADRTELTSHIKDPEIKKSLSTYPSMTLLDPEAIAEAVFYAISQPQGVLVNTLKLHPTDQVI